MVFGHVLMHIRVVLSDVALRAAVGNGPESEWRGIGVWTLELQGWEDKTNKLKTSFTRLKKVFIENMAKTFSLFGLKTDEQDDPDSCVCLYPDNRVHFVQLM